MGCVGRLVCGRLEDWPVRRLVGWLVGWLLVCGWVGFGLAALLSGCLVCWLVGQAVSASVGSWHVWFVGWLMSFVFS